MGCIVAIIISLAALIVGGIAGGPYRLLWFLPIPAAIVSIQWMMFRRRIGKSLRRWLRARLGRGRTVDELARRLGIDAQALREAQPVYSDVMIPKRNGGRRHLQIPDAGTKALQRTILHRLLGRLAVHPAAHAFERGRSIVTQAGLHVGQAVIIKIDLVDFFPATTAERIEWYFRGIGWNGEAARLLSRLTTTAGGLPQGAPTSPRLANLVNLPLDRNIARVVGRFKGTYTRYADDITISFPEDWPQHVRGIITYVRKTCKAVGYRVHGKPKLGIYRQHQRQVVCGLVVNQGIGLPRERRRWLRAVAHRLQTRHSASLSTGQLAGWAAYQQMIKDGETARVDRAAAGAAGAREAGR